MPKFHRTNKKRQAFVNGLTRALILHGKITTTLTRAKAIKREADKLINKAKTDNLATSRALAVRVGRDSSRKLIKEVAVRFGDRHGGYTRIVPLAVRKSDASKMAVLEIVN